MSSVIIKSVCGGFVTVAIIVICLPSSTVESDRVITEAGTLVSTGIVGVGSVGVGSVGVGSVGVGSVGASPVSGTAGASPATGAGFKSSVGICS